MRAVSFLGVGFAGSGAATGAPATGAPGGPAGLGGCPSGPDFMPTPGGFGGPGGPPGEAMGLIPGSEPGVGSGFGENAGTAGNDEGGGGTAAVPVTGATGGVVAGGGVSTRVVSFFGAGEAGAMRMVCPFRASEASAPGSADPVVTGGAGLKRTVSRFTTGASLGFDGNVIRTVSCLGVLSGGGVSEGVSSAIVIEFIFSISLWRFDVNSIVTDIHPVTRRGTRGNFCLPDF
jgi:hypothetical protein